MVPLRGPETAPATKNRRVAALRALLSSWCYRVFGRAIRCRRAARFVPVNGVAGCWVILAPRGSRPAAGWWCSLAVCRSRSTWAMWRGSLPIFGRRGTGRWCWGCCSAGCGQLRSGRCGRPMSILVCSGSGWSARAGRNGLSQSTATSLPSSTVTCARSARRVVRLRSVSSCCAARPADNRWARLPCGGSSAPTEIWPAPLGFGRTGCGTYGTELAAAGIDLLVLRDLMGHASPETTAGYVHLSIETLSAEYTNARAKARTQ